MKREVITEAMNNISENYRLEALELHNLEVSEVNTVSKKISCKKLLVICVAAAVTFAIGVTAYAAVSGRLSIREPEPDETISFDIPAFDVEATNSGGEEVIFHEAGQTLVYENVTREFSFDGPEACNEIQFMPTYIPEGYEVAWGNSDEWCNDAQGILHGVGDVYNICVYYASGFGTDGRMILEESVVSESVEETETEVIYSVETEAGVCHNYYYIVYNTVDGYIIVVSSSESMELSERIYNGLEIQTTGNVLTADSFNRNFAYLCNGVG